MDARKVVLVTGGARRIGAGIVRRLHRDGWSVIIHYNRSGRDALLLMSELNNLRAHSASTIEADFGKPTDIVRLARHAHIRWGRLDALVNSASQRIATPLSNGSDPVLNPVFETNYAGPVRLIQACLPWFAQGGAVVNVGDAMTLRPRRGHSAYHAAKAAMESMTRSMALELAPKVRVNTIAPGHMLWSDEHAPAERREGDLQQIPLQRLGGAAPVAAAVSFLLSEDASYITGAVLPVDGGLSIA